MHFVFGHSSGAFLEVEAGGDSVGEELASLMGQGLFTLFTDFIEYFLWYSRFSLQNRFYITPQSQFKKYDALRSVNKKYQ